MDRSYEATAAKLGVSVQELVSCVRKRAYGSRKVAKNVARETCRKGGRKVREYQCRYCGMYHVGRVPKD